MPLFQSQYAAIADRIAPGDVLAYSGVGFISDEISEFTDCIISHVGIVRDRGRIIEATLLNGYQGVGEYDIAPRVRDYLGSVWWLPLDPLIGRKLDYPAFAKYLDSQLGKGYNLHAVLQFLMRKLTPHIVTRLPSYTTEDVSQQFCSSIVAGAYRAGGVLKAVNVSAVSPRDIVQYRLYAGAYFQLKGEPREIAGFNSVAVL